MLTLSAARVPKGYRCSASFYHALKPALLLVLSYMRPAFVGIITGSMVIETI